MHHLEKARKAVAEGVLREETLEAEQGETAGGEYERRNDALERRCHRGKRRAECREGRRCECDPQPSPS